MTLKHWLHQAFSSRGRGESRQLPRLRFVPRLDLMEDRLAPAVLTVNSVADNTTAGDGLVTLREAIAASVRLTTTDLGETGDGTDTIRFASAIDGQTITLVRFENDLTPGSVMPGPSALVVTNGITLTLDGETGLTRGVTIERDATGAAFRLFYVAAGSDLTVRGLTLRGGLAQGGRGGGTGVSIDESGGGGGGAAGMGGAIFNAGRLAIQSSTLTGHTARGGAGGVGGEGPRGSGGGGLGENGQRAGVSLPENGGTGGGPNGGAEGDILNGGGGNGGFGGGGGGGHKVSQLGVIISRGSGGHGGFGGGGGGGANGITPTIDVRGMDGGNGGFGGGGGGAGDGSSFGTPGAGGFGGGNAIAHAGGGGAGMGGAIFNYEGIVDISNSTLAGNTANGGLNGFGTLAGNGYGSEVFNYNGLLEATYSTFFSGGNDSGTTNVYNLGNGVGNRATARINNSILGQSTSAIADLGVVTINGGSAEARGTNNLLRVGTTLNSGGTLDLTNTVTGDPLLGSLQNNGGRTPTLALLPGSPAIRQADGLTFRVFFDQRGYLRNTISPDIGAFNIGTPQTITFDVLANRTFGEADFALTATASSGLPVVYTASGSAGVYQDASGVWYVRIDGAGSATITADQAGSNAFEPATAVAQTFAIARAASQTTTVGAGPFTYNGVSQAGGSGMVTGAGGLNTGATSLTYSANSDGTGVADQTNAGTYYVTAHFAGDANHTASDGTAVAVVIERATATVSVSGYTGVYDGADHGATVTAAGVDGKPAGALDLGATFRNVPGGTAHWVFTGGRNYTDQSGDVAVVITRATPSVTVTPYTVTYDGVPHTATATVPTGVNGETGATVGTIDLSGTTHTDAGAYADSWSFVGGANYADIATTPITNTIDKAPTTTTVTIVGGPFPATGSAQTPAVVTVTGAGWLSLTPDASYADNVVPGSATAFYRFAGDANHTGSSGLVTFTITPVRLTAVGTPDGGGPRVTVRDADGAVRFDFLAFADTFRGGARVAVADVTQDGIDDIIVGAGPGGAPHVKVFDGLTGAELASFFAYQPSLRGGVSVGATDVDRDGTVDIVTGAGAGGAPHVKAFRFAGLEEVASFFAFDPSFQGGVNVASGDLDGDEAPELVFGTGAGGGPVVTVFGGAPGARVSQFLAGPVDDRGGVRVAATDLDEDGSAELVTRAAGVTRVLDPLTGDDLTSGFTAGLLSEVFDG